MISTGCLENDVILFIIFKLNLTNFVHTCVSSKFALLVQRSNKNFYEDYSEPITSFEYKTNCELLLQSEFKMVSSYDQKHQCQTDIWQLDEFNAKAILKSTFNIRM